MIHNENEYREAVQRLHEEQERLAEHRKRLEETGLAADEVKRALDPLRSFHEQLSEEIESYKRLKRGEIDELLNLHGLGTALVALRIALGLTQRELAERLGVHESQVSRSERNEYRAITVDRASRILDALGVELRLVFDQPIIRLTQRQPDDATPSEWGQKRTR
jgi:DNA-binding XRE family transcriptional regulator